MSETPASETAIPIKDASYSGSWDASAGAENASQSDEPQYKATLNKDFKIKLPVFEGPFDLLLYLIDQKQIALFDVPLSDITDAYLQYLDHAQTLQIDLGSEFLVLAAALIELKSKLLLPHAEPMDPNLLEELEQERMAILNRLFDYKTYKTLARSLEERREWAARLFTPDRVGRILPDFGPAPVVFRNTNLQALLSAFNEIWLQAQQRQSEQPSIEMFDERLTVAECVERMLMKLSQHHGEATSFRQLFSPEPTLGEIIVTFLALLELIRLGRVGFQQENPHSDILVIPIELPDV